MQAAPPLVPPEFWTGTEAIKEAIASRHIGRVIRAFRLHPHHGRNPLPQEAAAGWLGITQSKLSRVENGPRIDQLDILIHWARVLRIPARLLWFALPDDHELAMQDAQDILASEAQVPAGDLAGSSTARTKLLLQTVSNATDGRLRYREPVGATELVRDFIDSPSRVFAVKGAPGTGKTRLTHHLASTMTTEIDFQLHSTDSWDLGRLDLATEILRYASLPSGEDALLALERHSGTLRRNCLIVIDGIKEQEQFNEIGRQADWILRQVAATRLRFVLVFRTPPAIELSKHPVLAASLYERPSRSRGTSFSMTTWDTSAARDVWNKSREPGEPSFSKLPGTVQQLVRLPLYMQLIKAAGPAATPSGENAYRLIDYCVRELLRTSGQDTDRAMELLADLASEEAPSLMPPQLARHGSKPAAPLKSRWPEGADALPLLRLRPSEPPTFQHDVFREYFLAVRISELMIEAGRSSSTVAAFDKLANQAAASATAQGVFEFVVCCLDIGASDLLASLAVSPAVSVENTLPMIFRAAPADAQFATANVLRTCADRCANDSGVELSKALLATSTVADALGADYPSWVLGCIGRFGISLWADVATSMEKTLDFAGAGQFLDSADLDDPAQAIFFARYFSLFFGDGQDSYSHLDTLIEHTDWRVRAALAEGLRERPSDGSVARSIVAQLVLDEDYKVRAGMARVLGRLAGPLAKPHLGRLLGDENWHVRESCLQGVLAGQGDGPRADLINRVGSSVSTDDTWRSCPAHVATLIERLKLLNRIPAEGQTTRSREDALFVLLRELRTGWLELTDDVRSAVVHEGRDSSNWLIVREAKLLSEPAQADLALVGQLSRRETLRRLRDSRSVQVALDLHDLERAVEVALAAASAGVDLIEVGDPLIKQVGISAVTQIKEQLPETLVVAEMMSADWGRDQVVLAATAGADVVLLIGPAAGASVAAAVEAGQRLGVPILLDVPTGHATEQWIREMERLGVDGFVITTNIDLGVGGLQPLAQARAVRDWTQLPVAVSGGFSATDRAVIGSTDWDILIVGRSITEAIQPAKACNQLLGLVRDRAKDSRENHPA